MADLDLDAIEAALAKMTAGPWPEVNARGEPIVWHEMDGDGWTAIGPVHSDDDDNVTGGPAYIQAARDSLGLRAIRNAAPAMAAEIRTLRADLAAKQAIINDLVAERRIHATETSERIDEIHELRDLLAAARLDVANARSVAVEAIDKLDDAASYAHRGDDADDIRGWADTLCNDPRLSDAARAEVDAAIGVGRG